MAADTASSLTSTSHTLTAAPISAFDSAMASNSTATKLALLESLRPENRHTFLQPSEALPNESLHIVKDTLEGFLDQIGDEQQRRLKESRKRKRTGGGGGDVDVLKLRKLHVDGFETNQVWQQAKKIIGGVLKFSAQTLDELEERNEVLVNGAEAEDDELLHNEVEGSDPEAEDDEDEGSEEDEGSQDSDEDDQEDDLEGLEELIDDEALEEELDEEEGNAGEDLDDDAEEFVEDPNGLNDGFFSIDDFNRQTQWFEEQDYRGDPNTDQASDEEEIDWNKNYMAAGDDAPKTSKRKAAHEEDEDGGNAEDDSDEEDGPTFGDMALDAPEGASDDEDMDMDGALDDDDDHNANDIFYKDFFAPPPRKSNGDKPKKKNKSVRFERAAPTEEDMERAMDGVRRDLFDDESDAAGSESDALSDVSAGDPRSRRSAHERRQAKLAEEIRKLEAESVARREWMLLGEAEAADRPVNSLLEKDVDFEHVGKPVPVITAQVSEDIEGLIKRRILAQEFDEVLRRRPDAINVPATTRRGLVELDDNEPKKGLADVYEEEHAKQANPDSYVSKSDEKLAREEKEVEALWRDVVARLDALSSWHYKPKPAAPTLSVVADVATVSMEDAQPATAQGVSGGETRLAPQEVYRAGDGKDSVAKGELVTKSGLPLARDEMSREDKTRRRRRNKERARKAGTGGSAGAGAANKGKMQRDAVAADLKKGGVRVINKKGEITDVDGKKTKAVRALTSGNLKL